MSKYEIVEIKVTGTKVVSGWLCPKRVEVEHVKYIPSYINRRGGRTGISPNLQELDATTNIYLYCKCDSREEAEKIIETYKALKGE
tara:strand:- start:244 stop:501 length:258 start_codon:yes stop_codon:yes gene_type:complete